MGKKFLIGILFLVIVVLGLVYILYQKSSDAQAENIRKDVIDSLEQKMEFCEIIEDEISFTKGEFWLICNNRPFYVTYDNGNLSYDLNGWGFLKEDSIVWGELSYCDFYKSKKTGNDYDLIFYCPKGFDSDRLIAKIYRFDTDPLKMNKIKEKDFLEIISNDMKRVYGFLSSCEINNFTSFKSEKYPAVLWITFNCGNEGYVVGTDLAIVPIQPPMLLNGLSYEERAKISFENSFNLPIESISSDEKTVSVSSSFDNNQLSISYNFMEMPVIMYKIGCSGNMEECLGKFIRYFTLPPIEKITSVENIRSTQRKLFYKVDGTIIGVEYVDKDIIHVWRNTEGIYR